jgi:hypothetical protein
MLKLTLQNNYVQAKHSMWTALRRQKKYNVQCMCTSQCRRMPCFVTVTTRNPIQKFWQMVLE